MITIELLQDKIYEIEVDGHPMFKGTGFDIGQILYKAKCSVDDSQEKDLRGPQPPPPHELMREELKNLHVSLSRAIESGDPLTIGLVLGQTVKELENIINS